MLEMKTPTNIPHTAQQKTQQKILQNRQHNGIWWKTPMPEEKINAFYDEFD